MHPAFLAVALAAVSPAGTAVAQAAPPDDRVALLRRIELLERRLEQVERSRPAVRPERRNGRAVVQAAPDTPAVPAATPPTASATTERPRPAGIPGLQGERARAPQEDDIPQEAFVFRDQAVTLRPGRVEVSAEANYLRDRRTVSGDRIALGSGSLRAGVVEGLEVALTVPWFSGERTFDLAPGVTRGDDLSGLGDISLQANIRGWSEGADYPGAVFIAAAVAPTGPAPFVVPPGGVTQNSLPIDITRYYASRGTWALRGGVQLFKTLDPLVLFGGLSYEYAFENQHQGVTFQPGARYNYNAGVSFAVSERSTLGFTYIGSYTNALRGAGLTFGSTQVESALLRFSLVQRIFDSAFIEPAIAFGLVPDSPRFQVGLGLRYRF